MGSILINPREKQSFDACSDLAKRHYENFTVWSRLIRKDLMPFFSSIYAFCRTVDDIGDESDINILDNLDKWEKSLLDCYKGKTDHPYFKALSITIDRFDLPPEDFIKIIEANRQDQNIKSYKNFKLLEEYCELSANPVGRLVLKIMGYNDSLIMNCSNNICTGLQLLNFWQDIVEDLKKGRVYIPEEDMALYEVEKSDLEIGIPINQIRALIKFELERTIHYLKKGSEIFSYIEKKDQFPISLFLQGGNSIIKQIKKKNYDTLSAKIKISSFTKYKILMSTFIRLQFSKNINPQ